MQVFGLCGVIWVGMGQVLCLKGGNTMRSDVVSDRG